MHLGEEKTYVVSTHLKNLGEALLRSTHIKCFLWRNKKQITALSPSTYPEQFLCMFYFQNKIWHFMQIVSNEDDLHEVSKPIFWIN